MIKDILKVFAEVLVQDRKQKKISKKYSTEELREIEHDLGARNYSPKLAMLSEGRGCIVKDKDGKRYFDLLSAYSSVNQGHGNKRILAATILQLIKLAITSRAFENDQLPLFYKEITEMLGVEMVLPMNSGAEAVETAVKAVLLEDFIKEHKKILGDDKTRWFGMIHDRNLMPREGRNIIVADGNFHGRTGRIVGASSEPAYKNPFGPYDGLFKRVKFGDADMLLKAVDSGTVAVMLEPIQAEGGIIVPSDGYLKAVRDACDEKGIRLIFDEIQTGLGRTGKMFAAEHWGVKADLYCVGKALSGGNYPVSAVVGKREILNCFYPGSHGSTYGGNPVAAATAVAALKELREKKLTEKAVELGEWFIERLRKIESPIIKEIRGKGFLIGIALNTDAAKYCDDLRNAEVLYKGKKYGILCNDTHGTVIRIAPPLTIKKEMLEAILPVIAEVLR